MARTDSSSDVESRVKQGWRVVKDIPIAILITLFFNAAAMVWWTSQQNAMINNHAISISRLEAYDEKSKENDRRTVELLARLEERLSSQIRVLERLEQKLASSRYNPIP